MKFEKTFRDFVNEVINEAKTNGDGRAMKKLMKKKDTSKNNSKYKETLTTYANAFLLNEDGSNWSDFINILVQSCKDNSQFIDKDDPTKGVYCTKYQIIKGFFDYYFNVVYNHNVKNIQNCLKQAAETVDIEENDWSKGTIKQMFDIVKKAKDNKNIFVGIYNSIKRGY